MAKPLEQAVCLPLDNEIFLAQLEPKTVEFELIGRLYLRWPFRHVTRLRGLHSKFLESQLVGLAVLDKLDLVFQSVLFDEGWSPRRFARVRRDDF